MDKTEACAIIKCLQKNNMTPEETVALNCYNTIVIHQIQPLLTFICSLNSNHTFLVANLETIRGVEEYLEDQDATFFHEGTAMHEHRLTKYTMLIGTMLKKTVKNCLVSPAFCMTLYMMS